MTVFKFNHLQYKPLILNFFKYRQALYMCGGLEKPIGCHCGWILPNKNDKQNNYPPIFPSELYIVENVQHFSGQISNISIRKQLVSFLSGFWWWFCVVWLIDWFIVLFYCFSRKHPHSATDNSEKSKACKSSAQHLQVQPSVSERYRLAGCRSI